MSPFSWLSLYFSVLHTYMGLKELETAKIADKKEMVLGKL